MPERKALLFWVLAQSKTCVSGTTARKAAGTELVWGIQAPSTPLEGVHSQGIDGETQTDAVSLLQHLLLLCQAPLPASSAHLSRQQLFVLLLSLPNTSQPAPDPKGSV